MKIFGEPFRRRAEVRVLNSLSAHGDADDLFDFVREMNRRKPLSHVYLVHGEQTPKEVLAERLHTNLGVEVTIPVEGQPYSIV